MMGLGEAADIKWWYEFLTEECDLMIGRDWHWAWKDNAWAVDFTDPRMETQVRLKMKDDS
jgi:hypothetical protein